MEFQVLHNFIPPSLADQLEQIFLYNDDLTWGYREETSGVMGDSNLPIKESFQYQHSLFGEQGVSPWFQYTNPLMLFAEKALGFRTEKIERIKANTLFKDPDAVGKHHPPHMDSIEPNGYAMVYYVHDCDGDTIIFDKTWDSKNYNYDGYDLNEIGRIKPTKGSAVLFKSNRFHTSSSPTVANRRVILNHVFTSKDNFLTKTVDN